MNNTNNIHIDAGKDFYARCIDLYVYDVPEFRHDQNGEHPIGVMTNAVFTTTEPGAMRDPSLRITFESAQHLMDALWNCNIRPSEEPTAGQIQAMNEHLQDMRKLAFAKMEPFTRDGEEWTPTWKVAPDSVVTSYLNAIQKNAIETRVEMIKKLDELREATLYTKLASDTAEETIVEFITKKIDELRDAILVGDVSGLGDVATGTLRAVEPGAVVNLPADEEFDKSKKYYGPDGSLIRTTP